MRNKPTHLPVSGKGKFDNKSYLLGYMDAKDPLKSPTKAKGVTITQTGWETFEHFMQYKHSEEYPELLDDDLPDAYGDWISGLSEDEWFRYGEMYAKKTYQQWKKESFCDCEISRKNLVTGFCLDCHRPSTYQQGYEAGKREEREQCIQAIQNHADDVGWDARATVNILASLSTPPKKPNNIKTFKPKEAI